MLLIHIVIAVMSVLVSTFMYFSPSRQKINSSYVLLTSTLLSGTALIIFYDAKILATCLTGLAYTAYVVGAIYMTKRKLVASTVKIK